MERFNVADGDFPFRRNCNLCADGNAVTIGRYGKLELKPSAASTGSIASLSGAYAPAALALGAGSTLRLDSEPSEKITISGADAKTSKLLRNWSLTKYECFVDKQESNCFFGLTDEIAATATKVIRPNGFGAYAKADSGSTVDLQPFAELGNVEGQLTLTAESDKTYSNLSSNIVVRPATASSASVEAIYGRSINLSVAEESTITVKAPASNWVSAVCARFDFSTALDNYNAFVPPVSGTGYVVASNIWYDAAAATDGGPTGGYFLMCDKSWYSQISPALRTDGPNGYSYLDLYQGKQCRRAPIWSRTTGVEAHRNDTTRFKPKFAILVFDSSLGGGAALFGNKSSHGYMRAGLTFGTPKAGYIGNEDGTEQVYGYDIKKDRGLFKDGTIDCWIDGKKVNPSEQGLSGGWQVISVNTSKYPVDGFGFVDEPSSANDCGGQRYAEIIFFDRVLTDLERMAAERTLASKWSVSSYDAPDIGKESIGVAVSGKGTLALDADATLLPGSFRGSVNLNGKKLTLGACSLPPTEAVVSNSVMPRSWFDPNRESLLNTSRPDSLKGRKLVNSMYDVITTNSVGASYFYSRGRSPTLVNSARADGPELNWIDYSPMAKYAMIPETVSGPSLRAKVVGSATEFDFSITPITAQTIVMVQDSSKGGGTADLSAVSAISCSIDNDGAVTGAVTCPGALAFPSEVVVNVTLAAQQKSGRFTLVSAKSGLDDTAWSLNATGTRSPFAKLEVSADKVELVVKPGMLMIIK